MNKILLEVIGLTYSHSQSGAYALLLGEKANADNSKLHLPIIIGEAEAQSIAIVLEGYENKRPLTHDLFKTFATSFDINIGEVLISKFKNGLFFSELHCIKDGNKSVIDARTSDAVAIALRFKCPIFADAQVMEEAGIIMSDSDFETESDINLDTDFDDSYEKYDVFDLEELLKDAIENEDYVQASILRDEINKRKNTEV